MVHVELISVAAPHYTLILKGFDDNVLQLLLPDFWTSSIIWYSENKVFFKLRLSSPSRGMRYQLSRVHYKELTVITVQSRNCPHFHLKTQTDPVSEILNFFTKIRDNR